MTSEIALSLRRLVFCRAKCARISARSFLFQIELTILSPGLIGPEGYSASPAIEATQGKGR